MWFGHCMVLSPVLHGERAYRRGSLRHPLALRGNRKLRLVYDLGDGACRHRIGAVLFSWFVVSGSTMELFSRRLLGTCGACSWRSAPGREVHCGRLDGIGVYGCDGIAGSMSKKAVRRVVSPRRASLKTSLSVVGAGKGV